MRAQSAAERLTAYYGAYMAERAVVKRETTSLAAGLALIEKHPASLGIEEAIGYEARARLAARGVVLG